MHNTKTQSIVTNHLIQYNDKSALKTEGLSRDLNP